MGEAKRRKKLDPNYGKPKPIDLNSLFAHMARKYGFIETPEEFAFLVAKELKSMGWEVGLDEKGHLTGVTLTRPDE